MASNYFASRGYEIYEQGSLISYNEKIETVNAEIAFIAVTENNKAKSKGDE